MPAPDFDMDMVRWLMEGDSYAAAGLPCRMEWPVSPEIVAAAYGLSEEQSKDLTAQPWLVRRECGNLIANDHEAMLTWFAENGLISNLDVFELTLELTEGQ